MNDRRKGFIIPQIEDDENIIEETEEKVEAKPKENYKVEAFVSPVYGTYVKDADYYPNVGYGNKGRQYDSFRDDDKRVVKEDYSEYTIHNPYMNKEEIQAKAEKERKEAEVLEKKEEVVVEEAPKYIEPKNTYVEDHRFDDVETIDISKKEEVVSSPYMFNKEAKEADYSNNVQVHNTREKKQKYVYPPIDLLNMTAPGVERDLSGVKKQMQIINSTLDEFGIGGHVVDYTMGPTVTLFEIQLDPGVRYSRVPQIEDNFQGNLRAVTIRIEAPIPGKSTIGIEVPNEIREDVPFGDLMKDEKYRNDGKPLNTILGLDIQGAPTYLDITKMPHGLIAGSTGSGKSVCLNSIICSIIYKAHPDDVKLILIDPKTVEFAKYAGIPHLATPIITDKKLAGESLKWAIDEMENRYALFASVGAANIKEYLEIEDVGSEYKHIPYIVIIIDELADLMLDCPDIDQSIKKLTAKARAAGIHLIVATQRPSVDVISGTIKTNIPCRVAFMVKKALDSNIILDRSGAEKLLGRGDMLYDEENGNSRRIQGAYIDAKEIRQLVSFIKANNEENYLFDATELTRRVETKTDDSDPISDELFYEIARYIVRMQNASINNVQKHFGCGFNRIQAIVQKLEQIGVVGPNVGSKARDVLVEEDQLESILEKL